MLVAIRMCGPSIEPCKVIMIEVSEIPQRFTADVTLFSIPKGSIILRLSLVWVIRVLYDSVHEVGVKEDTLEKFFHAVGSCVNPRLAEWLRIVASHNLVERILAFDVVAKAGWYVIMSSFIVGFEDAFKIGIDHERTWKELMPSVECDELVLRSNFWQLQNTRLMFTTDQQMVFQSGLAIVRRETSLAIMCTSSTLITVYNSPQSIDQNKVMCIIPIGEDAQMDVFLQRCPAF